MNERKKERRIAGKGRKETKIGREIERKIENDELKKRRKTKVKYLRV